eukprot:SAG31_NODE_28816_length_404_cov_8.927869_1_plen_33_part_10
MENVLRGVPTYTITATLLNLVLYQMYYGALHNS